MSSAVVELDGILQSMLNLKPPGVSGSKITAITNLCNANVQSESVLIQKIYTHFKKTPGTHKLGVLYVVDSVTRQWVDHAKKSGQALNSGAPDGTYAAGVTRVTELLPVLMSDIIKTAPEDQKVKVKKLVEIWERSNTFPAPMLSSIKEKLDAPRQSKPRTSSHAVDDLTFVEDDSTTPIGSPTPGFVPLGQQATNTASAPAQQQDTSAILAALKNMAKHTSTPQPASATPTPNIASLLGAQNPNQTANTVNQGPTASNAQAVNPFGSVFAGMNNPAQSQQATNPLAALMSQQQPQQQQQVAAALQASAGGPDFQTQVQLIKLMAAQNIPPEQWGTALQILNMQNQNAGNSGSAPFPIPGVSGGWPGLGDVSRDRDTRSPPGQSRRRSRSPGFDRRRDRSPRGRRDSPGYDGYRDGRRGNDYRQRSPRRRRSPSPQQNDLSLPPPGPKDIQYDKSMPPGNIKVMSRTLFVGGVTSSEQHLRMLFGKFGIVQTCIVNVDKRHAFIKMINRKDAESARYGMEEYKDGNTQLRTKWGVGFGPRDCSDYQTGISIIPAERLTEADRKWLLTAEYGGTGGKAIEHGMIVEEPDIEIGAGVSSKAMSRRIPTDKGGQRGPQSSRIGGDGGGNGNGNGNGGGRGGRNERYRDDERRSDNNPQAGSNNMPNMPFPFPAMANGMPMIPGFPFPFPQNGQN